MDVGPFLSALLRTGANFQGILSQYQKTSRSAARRSLIDIVELYKVIDV